MNFYLEINDTKENAVEIAQEFARFLLALGADVSVRDEYYATVSNHCNQKDNLHRLDQFVKPDILITFGGDGTLLWRAAEVAKNNIPILGINVGTVGFLTAAENDRIEEIAQALCEQRYTIEKRAMLDVFDGINHFIALNEVALTRSPGKKLPTFEVFANGCLVDTYRADGFLVATPTGSTAYSLSAGGPILSPSVRGNVLTPICSHSLRNRPIVVGSEEVIKIDVIGGPAEMIVDGKAVEYNQGQVTVTTSQKFVSLIHFKGDSFYAKLFTKLNLWSKG